MSKSVFNLSYDLTGGQGYDRLFHGIRELTGGDFIMMMESDYLLATNLSFVELKQSLLELVGQGGSLKLMKVNDVNQLWLSDFLLKVKVARFFYRFSGISVRPSGILLGALASGK